MKKIMSKLLRGFSKVFSFTFTQQAGKKSYLVLTVGLALLLLLGIPTGMAMSELKKDEAEEFYVSKVTNVIVVDEGATGYDYTLLNTYDEHYTGIEYLSAPTVEDALKQIGDTSYVLVVKKEQSYALQLVVPTETALEAKDSESYVEFLQNNFIFAIMEAEQLSVEQIMGLSVPIDVSQNYAGEKDAVSEIFVTMQFAIPYVLIMILYFMILIYGPTIGNSIVSEKTSKLMDTFLVSVHPASLLGGKLAAIALSGVIQILSWGIGLIGGFAIGVAAVKAINPETTSTLVMFFNSLSSLDGVLDIGSIILTFIIVILGFSLFSSMFAAAGAVSSKVEDVGSSSIVIILMLVVAFLLAMKSSSTEASFLAFFPITSFLISPTLVLFGHMPVWQSLIVILLLLIGDAIVVFIAGKLYVATALYRGDRIKPNQLIKLFLGEKKDK